MKNLKVILTVLAVVILVTGCSQKKTKLECTQTASGVDVGFNVDFEGNIIKDINITYDMDLSKYNDTQIEAIGKEDFCSKVKEALSDYEKGFNNCTQNTENKNLNVKANIDINKISKKLLGNMQEPEKAKAEIEKQGYKCALNEN